MPSLKYISAASLALLLLSACAKGTVDKSATDTGFRPSKPYQATYSAPGNFAYQTSHVYSDGAGHMRMDISGQGPTTVHVLDLNKNETTAWSEGTNGFIRRPSQPMDPLVMRVRAENMPKDEKASLGARTINGHQCHGWRMAETEIWFDDDYHCPVTTTVGNQTVTLTDFSPNPPDPSVFQPPAGYTQVASRDQARAQFPRDRSRIMRDVELHIR